jgi:hypothetical protein
LELNLQSNLCTTTTLGTQKEWPLLTGVTGGRCSEVIYVIKASQGTKKWWSLWTGGRYSEMVVSSGLSVLLNYIWKRKEKLFLYFHRKLKTI